MTQREQDDRSPATEIPADAEPSAMSADEGRSAAATVRKRRRSMRVPLGGQPGRTSSSELPAEPASAIVGGEVQLIGAVDNADFETRDRDASPGDRTEPHDTLPPEPEPSAAPAPIVPSTNDASRFSELLDTLDEERTTPVDPPLRSGVEAAIAKAREARAAERASLTELGIAPDAASPSIDVSAERTARDLGEDGSRNDGRRTEALDLARNGEGVLDALPRIGDRSEPPRDAAPEFVSPERRGTHDDDGGLELGDPAEAVEASWEVDANGGTRLLSEEPTMPSQSPPRTMPSASPRASGRISEFPGGLSASPGSLRAEMLAPPVSLQQRLRTGPPSQPPPSQRPSRLSSLAPAAQPSPREVAPQESELPSIIVSAELAEEIAARDSQLSIPAFESSGNAPINRAASSDLSPHEGDSAGSISPGRISPIKLSTGNASPSAVSTSPGGFDAEISGDAAKLRPSGQPSATPVDHDRVAEALGPAAWETPVSAGSADGSRDESQRALARRIAPLPAVIVSRMVAVTSPPAAPEPRFEVELAGLPVALIERSNEAPLPRAAVADDDEPELQITDDPFDSSPSSEPDFRESDFGESEFAVESDFGEPDLRESDFGESEFAVESDFGESGFSAASEFSETSRLGEQAEYTSESGPTREPQRLEGAEVRDPREPTFGEGSTEFDVLDEEETTRRPPPPPRVGETGRPPTQPRRVSISDLPIDSGENLIELSADVIEDEANSHEDLDTSVSERPVAPARPSIEVSYRPEATKRKKVQWWEELFSDDYLRTVPAPNLRDIAKQCDFIEARLGLPPGSTILDVGCGLGLHAIELTRRGYLVVGLDLSLPMLSRAGDEAQDHGFRINFLHADMREMSFDGAFDAVICVGTTLGYFDDEQNRQVVEQLYRALKPRGLLWLDVVNRDFVVRNQPNLVWFEGDGCVVMEETHVNHITSRLNVKRTVILDDGRQRETTYSIRLYSLHELGQVLHNRGFRVVEVSGREATPAVFLGPDSPKLMILAERRVQAPPPKPPRRPQVEGDLTVDVDAGAGGETAPKYISP